ncbi:hypothetical protein CBR_g40106 [Chara braunii]|uniref:Uncharacterized protein n=1 Tax=Chara braunii TaxID=69332 RepID=A0A388LT16_CHABU|nr:hypothetical protein CBR_g40106 [Chara braunii]|eukprot:GBG85464.1 hypothetical protein CBR_g40106 [Chara braunii]
MEEIYTTLIQHRHNLPADLLDEGEELVGGWEEDLYADLPSQQLGVIENEQVMVELGVCAEMMKKVKGIFDELREGLYGGVRCDDVEKCCCAGPEEGQVLRTAMQDRSWEVEVVIRRGGLEEGRGPCGELLERDNDTSTIGRYDNTDFSTKSNDIAGGYSFNTNKNNNDDDNKRIVNDCGDDCFEAGDTAFFYAFFDAVADDNNNNTTINKSGEINRIHDSGEDNNVGDDFLERGDTAFVEVVAGNGNDICDDNDNKLNNNGGNYVIHMTRAINNNNVVGDSIYDKRHDNAQALSRSFHLLFSLHWSFVKPDQGLGCVGWVMGRFGIQKDCVAKRDTGWRRVGVG